MTRTEFDRYYERRVQVKSGVEGHVCLGCRKWVPVTEKAQHFEQEHLR